MGRDPFLLEIIRIEWCSALFFFGHIGPSLLVGRQTGRMNLAAAAQVAFWGVLPDLIDKPLFMLNLAPDPTARLWGHSLLCSAVLVLLVRRFLPSQWPWVLALPGHLVLDSMWRFPCTLFWPFMGMFFEPVLRTVPPEVFQQGLLYMYSWRWHENPMSFHILILGEISGLFMSLLVLRDLLFGKTWTYAKSFSSKMRKLP